MGKKFQVIAVGVIIAVVAILFLYATAFNAGAVQKAEEISALPTSTEMIVTRQVTQVVTRQVFVTITPSNTPSPTASNTPTTTPTVFVQGTIDKGISQTLVALTPTETATRTPSVTPTVNVQGTVNAIVQSTISAITPTATNTPTATETLTMFEAQATGVAIGQTKAAPSPTSTLSSTEVIATFITEQGIATATLTPSPTPTSTPSIPEGYAFAGNWTVGEESYSIALFIQEDQPAQNGAFTFWTRENGFGVLDINTADCSGMLFQNGTEVRFVSRPESNCAMPVVGEFWSTLRLVSDTGEMYVLSQ